MGIVMLLGWFLIFYLCTGDKGLDCVNVKKEEKQVERIEEHVV